MRLTGAPEQRVRGLLALGAWTRRSSRFLRRRGRSRRSTPESSAQPGFLPIPPRRALWTAFRGESTGGWLTGRSPGPSGWLTGPPPERRAKHRPYFPLASFPNRGLRTGVSPTIRGGRHFHNPPRRNHLSSKNIGAYPPATANRFRSTAARPRYRRLPGGGHARQGPKPGRTRRSTVGIPDESSHVNHGNHPGF